MISVNNAEIFYKEKCSSCHKLYLKSYFSKEEWENKLPQMFQEANLNEEEKKLLYDFILK